VKGSLSEMVGVEALESDKVFRTLGIYKNANFTLQNLQKETKDILIAYCNGVNEFIKRNTKLPFEFILLGASPTFYEPIDIIAWYKVVAYSLSMNIENELERYNLLQNGISLSRVLEMYPPVFESFTPTIVRYDDLPGFNKTESEIKDIEDRFLDNKGVIIHFKHRLISPISTKIYYQN
jgi:penicillin G amidase